MRLAKMVSKGRVDEAKCATVNAFPFFRRRDFFLFGRRPDLSMAQWVRLVATATLPPKSQHPLEETKKQSPHLKEKKRKRGKKERGEKKRCTDCFYDSCLLLFFFGFVVRQPNGARSDRAKSNFLARLMALGCIRA